MNTETKQRIEGMKKMVWVSSRFDYIGKTQSPVLVQVQGTYVRSLHGPIGQPKRKTNSERRQDMRAATNTNT